MREVNDEIIDFDPSDPRMVCSPTLIECHEKAIEFLEREVLEPFGHQGIVVLHDAHGSASCVGASRGEMPFHMTWSCLRALTLTVLQHVENAPYKPHVAENLRAVAKMAGEIAAIARRAREEAGHMQEDAPDA